MGKSSGTSRRLVRVGLLFTLITIWTVMFGAGAAFADYCDEGHQQLINECNQDYPAGSRGRAVCYRNAQDWYSNCVARKCNPNAMGSMLGC